MEETLETESDISTAKDEDRGPIELLDDLAANLPGRGNSKKHSLFELVRSHYKSEADFKTLKLVPTHELVSAIYPAKGLSPNELKKHITLKKKTFSSLKSSLNKTLRTLSETGLNPSGIVLNKLNLFTFSSNLEESKLPKSVEEPLLKKMSNLLSKEGMELKSDVEKKIRTLLSKELTRLKKNIRNSESVKKSATEKSKKLEEKLSEREKEISALKEKVTSFKTALNTQQQALQTEAPPPEPDTASESFPSSDVIEKLTSAIKEGIKKDLDTFKKSDALLDKMQNKLSKKEEQLLAGMEKLAEKEDELVKENLRQKEALEAAFQKDREEYEEQVSELRRKTESISEENEKLLDAQMGIQNDFDLQKKEEQQREVEAQEKLGEDRKKINQRIKELLKEEQKFFKEREFARKGFVSKEENIQKMAADQMLQGMKINEARRALETEKQEFKEELQKKFDDAVASLKADFDIQKDLLTKEKTALFHRRQEQDEAWTKLKAKEKELKKTIQERVKQETEKRKAELDQREKELEERVDKIIKEEQLLQQDKKNIVEKLSAGLGGKTSLLKLQGLIKNQEALMARKHKLLESEESFRKRVYNSLKEKSDSMQREIEADKQKLVDEAKELEEVKKSLDEKEFRIIEEQNRALAKYREKYEQLIHEREKEMREKEEEFNKKTEEQNLQESHLLKEKKALLEKESENSRQLAGKNDEVAALFEDNLQTKKRLNEQEKKLLLESSNMSSQLRDRQKNLEEKYQKKFSQLQKLHLLSKEKGLAAAKKREQLVAPSRDEKKQNLENTHIAIKEELLERSFQQLEQTKKEITDLKNEVSSITAEREGAFQPEGDDIDNIIDDKISHFLTLIVPDSQKAELPEFLKKNTHEADTLLPEFPQEGPGKPGEKEAHENSGSATSQIKEGEILQDIQNHLENLSARLNSGLPVVHGKNKDSAQSEGISHLKSLVEKISDQLTDSTAQAEIGSENLTSSSTASGGPGSPDDEIAGEKSDSAFPAKENVETEAGFLGGQEETGKNGGQAGESSHHDFSEEQETHSKTDTLSEESERQAEPSPGPPSEVPKGTSGINDGKPQVSTEATTGPPHGRAGEEPGGERSEDASQHDMGSENQGAQNKTDGGAKSQEDGAGSSGSPSEKSAETAAIGAEKPDYSQTGNLNGKGSGVLSGTPGEESKAPGSKGAGEVAAREKGAGEEEQLPQGANSSRPESPTEEIAPKGPGFLQDKAGSNTLGGSPGKGEGNGKNLSQGALEEGEKSEGTEEGARKGEKHPGSQENEKNHSFGKNGSEEVKLSNESEKEGSPITFGEENLLSKTTGEELETQIIQFNGNLEEFATSPAFLKAIAQKYNISYKIPSGEFEMGYDGYPDSTPRHRVKIDTGFIMSKFPVTNLQFLQFVKETGYTTSVEKKITSGISAKGGRKKIFDKHNRVIGYEDRNVSLVMDSSASFRNPFGRESNIADKYGHPVTQITWHDAVAYCAWLSGSTGKTFRLPTEAEWEFVTTNGGEISPDLFIEEQVELLSERSNFLDSLVGDTTPVDFYPDNKTTDGVCDMLGNVLEWTCDPFTQYPGSKKTDSLSADFKVTRGFGFIDPKTKANFWIRRPVKPMTAASYIGFRVVCEQN